NLVRSKEYSPAELKKYSEESDSQSKRKHYDETPVAHSKFIKNGLIWTIIGIVLFAAFYFFIYMDYGLGVFFGGITVFGLLQIFVGMMTKQNNTTSGLVVVLNDLYKMPKTMVQLSYVQFFANKTSRKSVHAISLICGGIGLASFYVIKDPNLLLISELGIGLAWASILAMPYAILTGSLPSHKMGVYMGIFNFFIVIPQITAAAILGFFVKNLFGDEAIYALLLGGVSFLIAALLVMKVDDVDEVKSSK
ncbi:MAG: MFS transporter, partial [Bacteroidetes bacterium]|nr:MFS transporter [Bacteroidota bacterium]